MKKIAMLIMVLGLVLIGCNSSKEEKTSKKVNSGVCDDTEECVKTDMEDYEFLDDSEHAFLSITWKQVEKRLSETSFTGVIYFGFADCSWCQEAAPIMNKVAKDKGLKIYYLDKKSDENMKLADEEAAVIKILDKAYGLSEDDDGNVKIYVPEVIIVENGKILDHHMGTVDGHNAKERKMKNNEKSELEKTYEAMFSKVE